MKTAQIVFVATASLAILSRGSAAWAEPAAADLLELHTQAAKSYQIFRDREQKEPLELHAKPVFNWTNLVGEHTQNGNLFIWTFGGRPEVIGTMFSTQMSDPGKRMIIHEFHTLSTNKLYPVSPKDSAYQWVPEAGIKLNAAEEAPPVAESGSQRLLQLRALARTFAAENRAQDGQTWELRLLPKPLWTYQAPSVGVLDGALFAMVSSAGTDPEIILVIEARHPPANDETWVWNCAAVRFSDKDLTVKRNGKPLWSSLDDEEHRVEIKNQYTLIQNRDKTYSCYRARVIDELP
jgi:hypothetical protein